MRRSTTSRAAAVLVLAALSTTAGCGRPEEEAAQAAGDVFPVETVAAGLADVSPVLSYAGTVIPARKALLGAQIQGPVDRLHVEAGDRVVEGDLLVELASEQLTQAEAQYVAAEKDWNRMRALFDKGAVTEQAFDQARAAYQAVKASYEMVLESTRIRAPFDGVISDRFLDEGEVFVLMPLGAASPAILEISKIDEVKIQIEVAERERPLARPGIDASVTVDAYPDRVFRGKLTRIDPGLDRMSRTSTGDILLDNSDEALRPGMFAHVELTLASREGLLIPRDALIRQEGTGSFFVYVIEEGTAHRRSVVLGDGFGANVEIVGGLAEGDIVVTAGRYKLHDGVAVEVAGKEEGR